MNLDTQRSKRIDAYIADPSHEVQDEKVRVMLTGEVHTLNVFRLPIDHLFYNIRNGRFAAELLAKEEPLKRKLDATVEADAKVIKDLLLSQDKNETAALKQDLLLHGQIDPGIITFDGAIINANRRAAILSTLLEETREPKFGYLKVGRLPTNVDEKDLWRIEAGLQFGKDFRLKYGPVNELLKLKEGRDRGLTSAEISSSLLGRFSPEEVGEKLEILKLIEMYLHHIGKSGEYHHVQQERDVEKFNSLYGSVVAPLRRRNRTDPKIAKLITVAFEMIDKTDLTHWDVRVLRKIAGNEHAYAELTEPFAGKSMRSLDAEGVKEAYTASKEMVVDAEEKDKPERLLKKALSAVQSIDSESPRLRTARARAILDGLADRVEELRDFAKK
jgi:hypothetical protein